MTTPPPARRRRIDRVTAPDYLDGIAEKSTEELRRMRDECREEEARLSYARRLLHGQLDIARAELDRRGGEGHATLVASLSEILADRGERSTRPPINAELYLPTAEEGRRRGDRVLEEVPLARIPDLDDTELAEAVTRLTEEERAISGLRRTVLDHLDALQEELVGRYRRGDALDDLITGALTPDGDG